MSRLDRLAVAVYLGLALTVLTLWMFTSYQAGRDWRNYNTRVVVQDAAGDEQVLEFRTNDTVGPWNCYMIDADGSKSDPNQVDDTTGFACQQVVK